jgi:transcriptional regulator with XRE-family HTH domain
MDQYIGWLLSEERIDRGATQADVAKILGVTVQQVLKYEKGRNRLPLQAASRLRAAWGFSVDALLDDALAAVAGRDAE